jgi:hypothetical protein
VLGVPAGQGGDGVMDDSDAMPERRLRPARRPGSTTRCAYISIRPRLESDASREQTVTLSRRPEPCDGGRPVGPSPTVLARRRSRCGVWRAGVLPPTLVPPAGVTAPGRGVGRASSQEGRRCLRIGGRHGRAHDRAARPRRGSCPRRTPRRGTWVGDVAGEVVTTSWSSPTTDEMGETVVAAHVEAVYVLAPRVRRGEGPGSPRNPELLL